MKRTRLVAEAGITIALSIVLSYIKIPIGLSFGGFGGSIDLVMIPLVFFALKWGPGWGTLAGLVFGTIKYFLGSGLVISWISIIFDYSVAYAMVGLAGLVKYFMDVNTPQAFGIGALIGCIARFIVHYISGVTVYAEWMPEEFMNLPMTSPAIYSLLYNGTYMLPNTILCVAAMVLLFKPLKRLLNNY
ncbi:MAG: energy-coupled thiamine transporter ThiT [Firmicutes bacterium]|nr:energy-coupled thiamine transporter ThiT [Bacillota bacterium]